MRRSRHVTATVCRVLFAVTVLLLVLPATGALGKDRAQQLLRDACRDGKVDGTYSQADFRRALIELPADTDQYTNCRDVLNAARLAALSRGVSRGKGSGGGGGNGGGGPAGGGGGTSGGGGATSGGGSASSTAGGARAGNAGASTVPATSTPSASATADPLAAASPGATTEPLATATPSERRAVAHATSTGAQPARLGGEVLRPSASGLSNTATHLPTSLIVLLAALIACALVAGGHTAYGRVHARRVR